MTEWGGEGVDDSLLRLFSLPFVCRLTVPMAVFLGTLPWLLIRHSKGMLLGQCGSGTPGLYRHDSDGVIGGGEEVEEEWKGGDPEVGLPLLSLQDRK